MSAAELLAELPRLAPDEVDAIRRTLMSGQQGDAPREAAGTGVRPAGYEKLFGCMADAEGLEIPERHRWRPAPKFD